ncbi:MAG: restriction endonuclease subunit S [Mycobacterium sp.]|nr:MAG: restriction endonuclease subunit S [Mycobacterium sp.]
MFERIKDVGHPDEQMLSVFRDYGVVAKDSRDNINKTAENRNIYQLVHPGWLVTNRMKAWQGSVGISELRGIVSGHYICFAPRHDEDSRFLNWLFRSPVYAAGYALQSRGVRIGQAEIDNDLYRVMPVLLPPLDEQRAIAEFLDRETARIDTLIAEQQRLIELLQERRDAQIESSVAPLEWNVPLRALTELVQTGPFGSQLKSEEYEVGGVPVVNPSHLQGGAIVPDRSVAVGEGKAAELSRHALEMGDVVVARRGELGRCAAVEAESVGFLCGTGSALIRSLSAHLLPDFLALVFGSRRNRDALSLSSVGSTMDNINADIISALRVPAPPLDEQRRIVVYLDEQTAKIDILIAETEKFIELARERRSAVITAAVTGQIDVRGAA